MEKKRYDRVMAFLSDGYGEDLCPVLLRSMERYVDAACNCQQDIDDVGLLGMFLRCLLKDEHGVDLR